MSNAIELIGVENLDHNALTIRDIFKEIKASFKDNIVFGNTTIKANSMLFPDKHE
jgi:hypothetical protein